MTSLGQTLRQTEALIAMERCNGADRYKQGKPPKIETEDNKSVQSTFSSVEIRKRQTNRGIEKQACEIEREKEKGPAAARILGTTAAPIKISDAIAHTRT